MIKALLDRCRIPEAGGYNQLALEQVALEREKSASDKL